MCNIAFRICHIIGHSRPTFIDSFLYAILYSERVTLLHTENCHSVVINRQYDQIVHRGQVHVRLIIRKWMDFRLFEDAGDQVHSTERCVVFSVKAQRRILKYIAVNVVLYYTMWRIIHHFGG